MAVHVDAIRDIMWMKRYASSRSVLLIRMILDGHLICMDAIMWRIMMRQNPYKHGWRFSFKTLLFSDRPGGPDKYQSWVIFLFV